MAYRLQHSPWPKAQSMATKWSIAYSVIDNLHAVRGCHVLTDSQQQNRTALWKFPNIVGTVRFPEHGVTTETGISHSMIISFSSTKLVLPGRGEWIQLGKPCAVLSVLLLLPQNATVRSPSEHGIAQLRPFEHRIAQLLDPAWHGKGTGCAGSSSLQHAGSGSQVAAADIAVCFTHFSMLKIRVVRY